MDLKRFIYDHSPVFVQNQICTIAGRVRNRQRYDSSFQKRCEYYREAGRWDQQQVLDYQYQRLTMLLRVAAKKIPFYQKIFKQQQFSVDQFKTLDDLKQLPMLSKDDVRKAGTSMINTDYQVNQLVVSHSGGSTGMPLTCYHDLACMKDVYACFWEYHRPGVKPTDNYATFQGMQLVPARQTKGPYWRMNKAMHQRLYSIYHISKETIRDYIDDLDRYKPVYFAGYANSIYLLAKLCCEMNIIPQWSPKAVFTTSEQLYPEYKKVIEEVFSTCVWDAYSQDETCASISQYECGYYHIDHAYGYVELDDIETTGQRKVAEIICSSLFNNAWPLIRYRVGDIVEYEPVEYCPKCGRVGPVIHEIRGRTGDVLNTPSGRFFPHISLIVKSLHGVRQVQLVQKSVDQVVIRFVPSDDFLGTKDEQKIIEAFSKAVGEPIFWSLEKVDKIPRTMAGKFRSIINEIKTS